MSRFKIKQTSLIINLIFALGLLIGTSVQAKIIRSDFLNQAHSGSDGPQLVEVEHNNRKIYLLNYLMPGGSSYSRMLGRQEYVKLIKEMNSILDRDKSSIELSGSTGTLIESECERKIIHTKILHEREVINKTICLNSLSSEEKRHLSQWIIELQKRLGPALANR